MSTTIAGTYPRTATVAPVHNLPFIIAASSAGTPIEWYDFYLYGVLAGPFASHFLPGSTT
jgi:hypothetical protein